MTIPKIIDRFHTEYHHYIDRYYKTKAEFYFASRNLDESIYCLEYLFQHAKHQVNFAVNLNTLNNYLTRFDKNNLFENLHNGLEVNFKIFTNNKDEILLNNVNNSLNKIKELNAIKLKHSFVESQSIEFEMYNNIDKEFQTSVLKEFQTFDDCKMRFCTSENGFPAFNNFNNAPAVRQLKRTFKHII